MGGVCGRLHQPCDGRAVAAQGCPAHVGDPGGGGRLAHPSGPVSAGALVADGVSIGLRRVVHLPDGGQQAPVLLECGGLCELDYLHGVGPGDRICLRSCGAALAGDRSRHPLLYAGHRLPLAHRHGGRARRGGARARRYPTPALPGLPPAARRESRRRRPAAAAAAGGPAARSVQRCHRWRAGGHPRGLGTAPTVGTARGRFPGNDGGAGSLARELQRGPVAGPACADP